MSWCPQPRPDLWSDEQIAQAKEFPCQKKATMSERYGRLTVLAVAEMSVRVPLRWLVRCDCGTEKVVSRWSVLSGKTQSCGCLQRERASASGIKSAASGNLSQYRHGYAGTPIYKIWGGMKVRCQPKRWLRYPSYTGVKHCQEWDTFEGFLANQPPGRPFEPGLQLSRIGDKGDYEPNNCRWTTKAENIKEMCDRRMLRMPDGRPARDVAIENGVPVKTMYSRASRGWDLLAAATTPRQMTAIRGATHG